MARMKEIIKLTSLPILFASLCCLSPIFLVLLGLSTVSFASSLADTFYGDYKWYFRITGLIFLFASLAWYFYKSKGICTIEKAKKQRNKIINTILIVFITGVLGYIFFLYVIVHYTGVLLKLWT